MRNYNIRINVLSRKNKSFVPNYIEYLNFSLPRFSERERYRGQVRINVEITYVELDSLYLLEVTLLLLLSEEDDLIINNGEAVSRSNTLYPYPTINVERK